MTTEQTVMRHKASMNQGGGPRPLMEIDLSSSGGGGGNWGGVAPEPPNTSHITDAIANINNQQATMREQVG